MAAGSPDAGGEHSIGSNDMSITLEHIDKSFGAFQALHGIDLDIPDGELIGLLGPSGSGKRPCCGSSPGLKVPTAAEFCSTVRM